MSYFVDRVVICDAYSEPDKHYEQISGGRSKLVGRRRPSKSFLASARDVRGGIAGVIGREANLFEEMTASLEQQNDFVNQLRNEIREWRDGGYKGTALVTRRLLEWWFERDEERKAIGQRFFFCQREAIETIIYLYEIKGRYKMPETEDLLRYALKLATGTGKTVVMALLVTWSTLHKRKVSGSPLSNNFLILVPNLTVKDRVSGETRGDGLDPAGAENLYAAFEMVPPEYESEFQPNVMVRNWQGIPLEGKRDDWISEDVMEEGRFVPASVLWAMQRRKRQDPRAQMRRFLGGWRDLVIINDEAHHVYGEKRTRQGEDPEYIKWSKIIHRINDAARISLVVDLSATPWYGSGSPKPEGTLFEWLVSDFSVYDAFESGLVKIVRLPEAEGKGSQYLDLWDRVKGARTKEEYLSSCKGAIASIYSDWSTDYREWSATFEDMRSGPAPVLLAVTDKAQRAEWLFEHLSRDYDLLRNEDDDDPRTWHTIRIDSKVFDAEKGNEAVLREIVNTVGKPGQAGERVRCIVSVNMLTEGWDVKSVTHILGLRAFGSPLLTEQIIGRGLRRVSYDVLNQPLEERSEGADETVDAFGIPFVGYPVQKKRRSPTGKWGQRPEWVQKVDGKRKYRMQVPNVRSWAVGVTKPLSEVIKVSELPEVVINPKDTDPDIKVRPVVGGRPEAVITLEQFRKEYPLMKTVLMTTRELYESTNPGTATELGIGPTFEEVLDVVNKYFDTRLGALGTSDRRDAGIYFWRRQIQNVLETAIRGSGLTGVKPIPILSEPATLDTEYLKRFQWTGITAEGKKCHTSKVPCHTDLEKQFADFLDAAGDVIKYLKNERFGFSVTYYENNRPRQYYPDFIVLVRDQTGNEISWIVETKGEMHPNTKYKREAAELWCAKMSETKYGRWNYLFVQQKRFELALRAGVDSFIKLINKV